MKLLIVDDEMQIRTGLEQGIDWSQIGITEVFTAENGVEALEISQIQRPEIVITDIRMPGIDGLKLSHQLVKMYDPVKIIILSGYSEFEYAREAIKIGVVDYLIKPINIEELVDKVERAREFILTKRNEGKYKKEYLENSRKEQIEKYVLGGSPEEADMGRIVREYTGLSLNNLVFLGSISLDKSSLALWDQVFIYLMNYLDSGLSEFKAAMLFGRDSRIVFVCEAFTGKEKEIRVRKLIIFFQELNRIMENQYQVTISAFFSTCREIKDLPHLYGQCLEGEKHRLYMGKESFLEYEKLKLGGKPGYTSINEGLLKEQIKLFSYEKSMEYIRGEFDRLKENKVIADHMVKEICIQFKNILIAALLEKGIDIESLFEYNAALLYQIPQCITLDEYLLWVDSLYYLILQGVIQLEGKNHSRITVQAVDYVMQNYNRNIDLESVAAYVNKSKNYFSYLFKKELGLSFTEYLNRVRVENAKILLITSDKLTYEISEEVGYSDYKYFCSVFKKMTGVSPGQYRKN